MTDSELKSSFEVINNNINKLDMKIEVWKAQQAEICRAAKETRETHDRVLFGNGQPGISQRVQTLEDNTPTENSARMKIIEEKLALIWFGVLSFIYAIGNTIWSMISSKMPGNN